MRALAGEAWLLSLGPPSRGVMTGGREAVGGRRRVRVVLVVAQRVRDGLARDLGYEIVERRIFRSEIYTADEAFLTGTAAEVAPIREVDGRAIGAGTRGRIGDNHLPRPDGTLRTS